MTIDRIIIFSAGVWLLVMTGCAATRETGSNAALRNSSDTTENSKGKTATTSTTAVSTLPPTNTIAPPPVPPEIAVAPNNRQTTTPGVTDTRQLPFEVLYFDFDSTNLRQETREALVTNFGRMTAVSGGSFVLEGHCDELGSAEYNQALGERRAKSVEKYLAALGFATERLFTVSYGKELPAIPGSDEEARAKNRRVEIKLKRTGSI